MERATTRAEAAEHKAPCEPTTTTTTTTHGTAAAPSSPSLSELHRRARVLSGRVALVTGGSRGIGAAIALAFGESGAHVALSYARHADAAREVVKKIESTCTGVRAIAIQADHAKDEQVVALVNTTLAEFGRLDIIVNNAGRYVSCDITSSHDLTEARLEQVSTMWKINTDSAVWCVRAAAQRIAEHGRIINIGSISAEYTHGKGVAEYAATKAALRGYTKGWARDFAEKQVTVNLVQPGHIATEMNPPDGAHAELAKTAPAKRHGTCDEVAEVVLFLASSASSFVNGATITVDGGFTA